MSTCFRARKHLKMLNNIAVIVLFVCDSSWPTKLQKQSHLLSFHFSWPMSTSCLSTDWFLTSGLKQSFLFYWETVSWCQPSSLAASCAQVFLYSVPEQITKIVLFTAGILKSKHKEVLVTSTAVKLVLFSQVRLWLYTAMRSLPTSVFLQAFNILPSKTCVLNDLD